MQLRRPSKCLLDLKSKTSPPNATHERNCKTYSEKHKISSCLFTLHFLKSGVGIAGSHLSALLKMSFSSNLLSARSAAGVGVDAKGTSGAVAVATLWIGAGGGGGTLTPAAADKPGDRDIGGEDGKLERGNSGLSPKPVIDTPDNPSDETLCGPALITGVPDATSVSTHSSTRALKADFSRHRNLDRMLQLSARSQHRSHQVNCLFPSLEDLDLETELSLHPAAALWELGLQMKHFAVQSQDSLPTTKQSFTNVLETTKSMV